MFQFNLRLDPEIIEDLNLNEDTVIEAYFDNGTIIVRILDEDESEGFDSNPCSTCNLFCKAQGICTIHPNH